jgi:pSer/pThr/pTyr-binding forkhead associated (FHA) protein
MDVVLVMFKGGKRREFPMHGNSITVGRRPESDLRVPTADVSREHCELVIEDGKLIVHDVGSSNGTFVNGESIDEIELSAGDQLRVGPVTFVIQINGEPKEIKGPDVTASTAAQADSDDTGDLLDLDDFDFESDDPITAVESMLDDDDDETV